MKKFEQKPKRKVGRPRKEKKSIDEFVSDIEKERLSEQEQELFFSHADHAEIQRYVRTTIPTYADDDVDSFSYWYGQN